MGGGFEPNMTCPLILLYVFYIELEIYWEREEGVSELALQSYRCHIRNSRYMWVKVISSYNVLKLQQDLILRKLFNNKESFS